MAMSSAAGHLPGTEGHRTGRPVALLRGRDIDRALDVLTWTTSDGTCTGSLQVRAGTALIELEGHLGRGALSVCRAALDAAIHVRPSHLIVDLGRACTDEDSAGLLALMARSATRHGLVLHLAEVPAPIQLKLATLAPLRGYQVYPNLAVALRLVTGAVRPEIA